MRWTQSFLVLLLTGVSGFMSLHSHNSLIDGTGAAELARAGQQQLALWAVGIAVLVLVAAAGVVTWLTMRHRWGRAMPECPDTLDVIRPGASHRTQRRP